MFEFVYSVSSTDVHIKYSSRYRTGQFCKGDEF